MRVLKSPICRFDFHEHLSYPYIPVFASPIGLESDALMSTRLYFPTLENYAFRKVCEFKWKNERH